MESDYHYIDPENKYTDINGLLRNLADIKDEIKNFRKIIVKNIRIKRTK